jgi:low affinity Fe/Cu permease
MGLGQVLGRIPAMILYWLSAILFIIATVLVAWDDYIAGATLAIFSLFMNAVGYYILYITQ